MIATAGELLAAASTALAAGRFAEARTHAAAAVAQHPRDSRAWFAHAELERAHGQLVAAHAALLRSLELDPERFDAALLLAVIDAELGDAPRARAMLQRLRQARPTDLEVMGLLADSHERAGESDQAAELVAAGLASTPRDPLLNLVGGRLARQRNELDRAELLLARANAGPDAHLTALAWREQGWLAEARGAHEAARAAFAASNSAERARWLALNPGPNPWLVQLAAMRAVQTPAWYASWTALSTAAPDLTPLPFRLAFLVGFPRSGTTLLEQVIGTHPDCATLEERPPIRRALRQLDAEPGGYPAALATLSVAAREAIRANYVALVEQAGGGGRALVLDKFPLKSADLAAMVRLFPEAHFVFAERDPRDVVLSCWMNGFRLNHEMACFTDLTETVTAYDAVLTLWHDAERALAPPVHRVRYERVVDDLEGEARALLGFLGLAWNAAVLDPASRARGRDIRTPSYAAVRGALHTRARERWRNHLVLLGPELPRIEPWVVTLGYGGTAHGVGT